HSVDNLDTSRTVVFLTSNRPDLVDEAILDRFLAYAVAAPDPDLFVEVAVRAAEAQQLGAAQIDALRTRVRRAAAEGGLVSIRDGARVGHQDTCGVAQGEVTRLALGGRVDQLPHQALPSLE